MRTIVPIGLLTLLACGVMAQNVEQVAASAESDLKQALDHLASVQKQIAAEKIPLSQKLNELESKVTERRREVEKAQRFQENQLVELNALKTEVNRAREQNKFLTSLLGEYATRFETRIHIGEVERYRQLIADAKGVSALADMAPAKRFERQAALVDASLGRLEGLVGGETFAGRALGPDGVMKDGKFLIVGPSGYFASSDGSAVGAVQLQLGSPEPAVIPLSADQNGALRQLIESGKGVVPVDATMGNALKFQETKDTFVEHLMKGGPVMVPILALGLISVLIFIIRWVAVGRVRVASSGDLQSILDSLGRQDTNTATNRAGAITGPVGEMLKEAIRHFRERKEYVEEVMYEKMLVAKPELEKMLPFLALSAAAAPLLGLLGTVTGMINTFNAITVLGAGDPKTLAGGISEALITTEFGLIVAIPSLLLHAVLSRKVKGIMGSMEQTATGFINGLPGQSQETIFLKKS